MHKHIRQANRQDFPALLDLIYQSFAEEKPGLVNEMEGNEVREIFQYYFPYYQPEDIFVAEINQQIVSMAGIVRCTFTHETEQLSGGLINPVATHPQYRNQGLAAACLEALTKHLRTQGVALLYLQGHPGYYPRFGFVPGYYHHLCKVATTALLKIDRPFQLIPANSADLQDILALYNSHTSSNLLRIERDQNWITKKFPSTNQTVINTVSLEELFLLKNEGCKIGYAIIRQHDDELFVEEVALSNPNHLRHLLKGIGILGQQHNTSHITFVNILPEDPLYRHLLDLGGQSRVYDVKAFMFQVLSPFNLLHSLHRLLESRIARSNYAHSPFLLTLECEDEVIRLKYEPEVGLDITNPTDPTEMEQLKQKQQKRLESTICEWATYHFQISRTAFTKLFTGYRQIHQLVEDGECPQYDATLQDLIGQLFPKVYLYYPDLHAN